MVDCEKNTEAYDDANTGDVLLVKKWTSDARRAGFRTLLLPTRQIRIP